MSTNPDIAVRWPSGLVGPLPSLVWGAPCEPPTGLGHATSALGPIARVAGLELDATLVFELDRLVRVELRGALDGLALAALGCSPDNLVDEGYHRLASGGTRVDVDALDGLVILEQELP